ncbi:hypothetical protein [Massilia psychrophila]|jgi:transposase-like protein|uniref:DDE domain-containing protein n=1 Tax=Massilia psychrophila TaxID=1603353 RepID=A0A2G8SW97_9BURK|nr:hypothetical protein CR103_20500 [Massilia psychrophila]
MPSTRASAPACIRTGIKQAGAVKPVTSPMLNFKSFRAARCVFAGIELMHMIRKGQFTSDGEASRPDLSTAAATHR